jgi:hypothetical protein
VGLCKEGVVWVLELVGLLRMLGLLRMWLLLARL